jgi:hypothetical protein
MVIEKQEVRMRKFFIFGLAAFLSFGARADSWDDLLKSLLETITAPEFTQTLKQANPDKATQDVYTKLYKEARPMTNIENFDGILEVQEKKIGEYDKVRAKLSDVFNGGRPINFVTWNCKGDDKKYTCAASDDKYAYTINVVIEDSGDVTFPDDPQKTEKADKAAGLSAGFRLTETEACATGDSVA